MLKQREAKERKGHGKQEVRDKETHDRETLRELTPITRITRR